MHVHVCMSMLVRKCTCACSRSVSDVVRESLLSESLAGHWCGKGASHRSVSHWRDTGVARGSLHGVVREQVTGQ